MINNSRDGFRHKAVLAFSIVLLVCGCTCVVLGVCLIFVSPIFGMIGTGIWSGVGFIVTSILGFKSWKFKTNCNIIALMVLCIISAGLAFSAFVMEIMYIFVISNNDDDSIYSGNRATVMALDSLLAVVIFVEFIISIVCSAFCCKAFCCGQRSPEQVLVYAEVQPDQHMVMPTFGLGAGQSMDFVQAPVAPPVYVVLQNPSLPAVTTHDAENTHTFMEGEKDRRKTVDLVMAD